YKSFNLSGVEILSIRSDYTATERKEFGFTTDGQMRFYDNGGTNYFGVASPSSLTQTQTVTWPQSVGGVGQVLGLSGTNTQMAWVTMANPQLNNLSGVTAIPVNLIPTGNGSQSLGTAANPWNTLFEGSSISFGLNATNRTTL